MKAGLAILGLALALMAPSQLFGPLAIDSAAFNAVWTSQFAQALGRGELYPRWLPGSFEGLGSPTFYFYPPLAFYLSGMLRLAGLATGAAINGAALLALAASGGAMYAWLRFKGGRALLGALLYMAAPYHLIDFYVRAALAEFSAFVWLPLIALAIEAYPRRWAGPLLALSFAGLIMTHLPMAVLAGLFLIGPMIGRRVLGGGARLLPGYVLAGAAAVALSGLYLVPALTLQAHISSAALWTDFYQPGSWSPFAHGSVVRPAVVSWPAPLAALSVLAAATAAWTARAAGRPEPAFWAAVVVGCALLGLALVPGVWGLPALNRVQFPWRIFALMEFAAVTAVALAPTLPRRAVLAVLALAAICQARIVTIGVQTARQSILPPDIEQALPDAAEYLPAGFDIARVDQFNRDPDLAPLRGPPARGPVGRVWRAADGSMRIQVTAPGTVVARAFAFPQWRVQRDGRPIPIRATPVTRLIAFEATPGVYTLERRRLPQEIAGLRLSLLGLALLAAQGLTGLRPRRTGA